MLKFQLSCLSLSLTIHHKNCADRLGGTEQTLNAVFLPLHMGEKAEIINPQELSNEPIELMAASCGNEDDTDSTSDEERPTVCFYFLAKIYCEITKKHRFDLLNLKFRLLGYLIFNSKTYFILQCC